MDYPPKKSKLSGFFFLNTTQFLGALNDNLYKLLLIFFLIDLQGDAASPLILALSGAIFVIPFLLFSIPAGTLADRISKSKIVVFTKWLEIGTVSIGILGFILHSPILLYTGLFFLALQSAIFGPSKYGIIPEIVPKESISKSNGYISSFTFLAIIIGTFLAALLTQLTGRNFVLSSLFCFLVALVGIITSLKIPKTAPAGSTQPLTPFFFKEIGVRLKEAKKIKHLLLAILGSGYFLLVGSFTQLNIIPYAITCLGLDDVQGGYLFLITALGIGAGALIAGKVSGSRVELGMVPIGGIGISICCLLLGKCTGHYLEACFTLFFIGLFGGIYLVPLDSYIQFASPNDVRGKNVATNNFGGFLGVLISSGLIYLWSNVLKLSAATGFFIIGLITTAVVLSMTFILREKLVTFLAYCFVRPSSSYFQGKEQLPEKGGALLFSKDWKNALPMLSFRERPVKIAHFSAKCTLLKRALLFALGILPVEKKDLDALYKRVKDGEIVYLIGRELSESDIKKTLQELNIPLFLILRPSESKASISIVPSNS